MTDNEKNNLITILGLLVLAMAFVLGFIIRNGLISDHNPPIIDSKVEIRTDTIFTYKTDTLYKYITHTVTKPTPIDTHIDTTTTDTFASREIITYQDTLSYTDSIKVAYSATVSGIQPSLDTLSFKIKYPEYTNTLTSTITNEKTITKTIYKKPKLTAGLSIGTGYGIINKKADVFIGFSLQVPIFYK